MAANEAKRKAILTGQVTTGQTQAVSDRVRQGAVPEYARGPGGKMKYIGSAYKSPGQTGGWLSRLFGGQNKYGYAPTYTKGIQFNPNRGRLDRQGEYQFTDPRTGNIKPGWGGRILGGLAGLATGIPFVGGAIGSAIDKGKGIFGKTPRDMSQYNQLSLTPYNERKISIQNDMPMESLTMANWGNPPEEDQNFNNQKLYPNVGLGAAEGGRIGFGSGGNGADNTWQGFLASQDEWQIRSGDKDWRTVYHRWLDSKKADGGIARLL